MSSMTFLINDSATSGGTNPVLQVTITENADGTVTFNIIQLSTAGSYLGDLRGLFFDLADERLIGSLTTAPTANLTELQQGNDTVTNLGDGANMSGLVGDNGGYDVGVEIGTSGIGSNDIRSFSFTLDSSLRNLTLADFSNVSFGARVTSVGMDINGDGTIDTARTGSSKTGEVTIKTITPVNDSKALLEDTVASGNVLSNDGAGVGDTLSVTGWTGGALGTAVAPAGLYGATVTLNANGTYTIDASAADALAAGQVVTKIFTYTVLQTNVDGTSLQTATLTVTITGTNDAATVSSAVVGLVETNAPLSTSGVLTSTDVDNPNNTFTASATVGVIGNFSIDAAGAWSFTANSAFDNLNTTDSVTETYNVTSVDGTPSTVKITITGTNDAATVSSAVVVAAFDVIMVIPRLAGAVPDLDKTDPALDEAAGDQHLAPMQGIAIHFADGGGLAGEVKGIGSVHLHTIGQLKGLDPGFQLGILVAFGEVAVIQFLEQIQLAALFPRGQAAVADVLDEFVQLAMLGVDVGALKSSWQKPGLPVLAFLNGITTGAHGDEAREILIQGAEPVGHPGPHAGTDETGFPAVHQEEGWLVVGDICMH